jgi:phosphatidylinositol-3-phosphatase
MKTVGGRWLATVCCVLALGALAGCGGSSSSGHDAPKSPPSATSGTSTTPTPTATPSPSRASATSSPRAKPALSPVSKVLVVIEENHSYEQMKQGMPFLAHLSETYGYATHWTALAHPSLPNYVGIAGGSTFGITDDKAPTAHTDDIGSAPSVFDQALASGKTAATYAESMPDNCHPYDFPDRSVGKAVYAVRHNPWTYFSAGHAGCLAHDTDLGGFSADAAGDRLPNVGFLIPNLVHDAHNASLGDADAWLRDQLTPVLQSRDFSSGRLVVVVTADEDDRRSGNVVLTSVLTPHLSHRVVDSPLTHYSLTRFLDDVLGVQRLRNAADAPDLRAAFGF